MILKYYASKSVTNSAPRGNKLADSMVSDISLRSVLGKFVDIRKFLVELPVSAKCTNRKS
jgi:hypothetical protein